jgi:hypothetical protein
LALRTVPIGAVVLVMVIGPSVAVGGTVAVSFVAETNVTALAATPLNFTVELLVKPTPVSVTTVPAGRGDRAGAAERGERAVAVEAFDVLSGGDEQLPGVAG